MSLVIFVLACGLGQFLQTTIGFGLNVLVMAIASTMFPVPELASVCTLLSFVTCGWFMYRWRKYIRFSIIKWLLITMFPFSVAAILTIRYIPVQTLRGVLGLVLIVISIFFLCLQKRLHFHATSTGGLAVGALSGVLAGYFAISGPPLVAYLLSTVEDKETYLASIQTIFFFSNLWMIVFRAYNGYIDASVLRLCLIGGGAVALGAFLGVRLFHRLNFDRMRTLAYAFIGLCGVWMVLDVWILH